MSYTLIEPCCGSAALTLHMLGARNSIMPYQGSKWKFRHALERVIEDIGFGGSPSRVELSDIGFWPLALRHILGPNAVEVIRRLERLEKGDPREVFNAIQGSYVGYNQAPESMVAEFLFLQRLAFSGKAVGIKEGKWNSPGFNETSAYGKEGTDKFGTVNPMIPSLIRTLKGLELEECKIWTSVQKAAYHRRDDPSVIYLDPWYVGTTKYPDGTITRDEVVDLAVAWHDCGAGVIVSERKPLKELTALGWDSRRLYKGTDDKSPFKGKHEEWVTFRSPRGARL